MTEEHPSIQDMSVDQYLAIGVEYECSDIHITTAAPPHWRRHGVLQEIWEGEENLKAESVKRMANEILTEKQRERLERRGDVDFAYENEWGRYRASVVEQRLGLEMVFRIINSQIRTMEELGLPETIKPLLRYHNGLIMVTGSVGSGKSTTMASLINHINHERNDHIITLEDPIEFIYESAQCHVNQREIERHTESYARALRASLREDPDIIMLGEMRDLETIQLAITAAETGHLVIGTLHTGSAPRTLDRILDVFPPDQRDQIRIMVSESLRGIISQQLIPRADGTGRIMAMELLVNNPAVAASIRDGKTFMLPGIMQTGKNVGMITMDDSLKNLYVKGLITQDDLLRRSNDREAMKEYLAE